MRKKLFIICFTAIILLGSFLRFYQLSAVPGSLEYDEVSFGYNAHSILQTGKDEYGAYLPFSFRAFGEYKQPVYMYLDVAAVKIFGLNNFAVRFPAALLGSLTILFVYLLVHQLFKKYSYAQVLALLSMFLFAISPWAIQFSRAAFEATVALFLVIAGVWLFLKGIHDKKPSLLFISIFVLSLSTYTYISQKIFVPIIFISLLAYAFSYLKKQRKLAIVLIAVFTLLNTLWLFDAKSISRGQGVLFTNQSNEFLTLPLHNMQFDSVNNDKLGEVLHNRRIIYGQELTANYLSHFNPVWLFVSGDTVQRHHAPSFGLLYIVSLPLILLGIYFLLSRIFSKTWILFVWFLCAPFASTLTFEAPHALRSLIFLPIWQIFEAVGILALWLLIKNKRIVKVLLVLYAVLLTFNFIFYTHQYFVHTNTDTQKDWQYGYKEAILFATKEGKADQRIIFSHNFEQPYIFYLFYKEYDPEKYLAKSGSWRTSKKCYTIDNAYFGHCMEQLRKGDLYISIGDEPLKNVTELKSFKLTSGEVATKVLQSN